MYDDIEEPTYKMLLPVSSVPVGSTVTKKTGQVEYKIQNRIRIFDRDDDTQEIVAQGDTAFLVPLDGRGDVNVITGDTEVIVHMAEWELLDYIDPEKDK